MKLLIALALALAPRRAHADGPPAKGLRAFEGEPGDKKFVDASSRDAARKPPFSRDASSTRAEGKTRAFAIRGRTLLRRRLATRVDPGA